MRDREKLHIADIAAFLANGPQCATNHSTASFRRLSGR
jgi:hypothetical protein